MLLIDSAGYNITAYADKKPLLLFGAYLPLPGRAL